MAPSQLFSNLGPGRNQRIAMMECSGKLTKDDLAGVALLLRPRRYWVSFLLETWYGAAMLVAIAWATILGFVGRTSPNWWAMGLIWLVIAGIVTWSAYTVRRDRMQGFEELNAALPDRLELTTEGIRWIRPTGGRALLRWSELGGWRERRQVIAIDDHAGVVAVFLPIGRMPELERERLREFLKSRTSASPFK